MEVRPSDGLALAVRLKAPVLTEEHLLSSAETCGFLSSLRDPCKGLIFTEPPWVRETREPGMNHGITPRAHN
jgi:hypothetical protein